MGPSWRCARSGLRHAVGASVALVLLTGATAAVVLAALAGAHRSDTAFDRFMTATRGPDAIFQPQSDRELDQVRRSRVVRGVAPFWFVGVAPEGLTPGVDSGAFVGGDAVFGYEINRPVVRHGRLAEAERADEVTVNAVLARRLDLAVGDTVTLGSITPEAFAAVSGGDAPDDGEAAGPSVRVRVVGIVASFLDLATNAGSPTLYPTPAFFQRYDDEIAATGPIVLVDLVHGVDDEPAFRRVLEAAAGDGPTSDFGTRRDLGVDFEQAARVQARALLVFAAIAALAGFVAVGQALARHLARTVPRRRTTAALGMTRRQHVGIGLLVTLPIAVGGALLSVPLAVAASPLLPIGLSRQAEPHPGVAFDAAVLVPGAVLVGVVVVARGALSAWALTRPTVTQPVVPSPAGAALARGGAPASTVVGVGMAGPRQPAPLGAAARGALLAGVAGTALLAGILTFSANLDRLVSTPARYGAPFDRTTTEAIPGPVARAKAERLAAIPGVGPVTVVAQATITALDTTVAAGSVEAVGGPPAVTVTAGRLPLTDDEVFMGAGTLRNLGLRVGDVLTVAEHPVTIVGYGLLPAIGDLDPTKIALFTPAGLRAAEGDVLGYFLWFTDDSPGRDGIRWADEHLGATSAPAPPPVIENLADIDRMPDLLAAFVGLLAAAALAHLTVTTVRWRRGDLAVLRVLGFSGRHLHATIRWQAWVPVLVGLLVGIPVGVALGRWVWVVVAHAAGAQDDATIPLAALAALVPVALLFAAAVAAPPGRSAARLLPAAGLRSE